MTTPELMIRNDSIFDQYTLATDYSQRNLNIATEHFDEIHTAAVTDNTLISNFLRFRLAQNRPSAELDYVPTILHEHFRLIWFVRNILNQHYNNQSFLINFSPAIILNSHDNEQNTKFLYASTNFLCLENSVLVHNDQTLNQFIFVNGCRTSSNCHLYAH